MSIPTQSTRFNKLPAIVREEWFLGINVATSLVFLVFGRLMMERLPNPLWLTLVFVWFVMPTTSRFAWGNLTAR